MSRTNPSNRQQAASKTQSLADQGKASKKAASRLQSEADRSAVTKHGL